MIAPNCNMSATAMSHEKRRRTGRITRPEYHFPSIPSLDSGNAQRETGINRRANSRGHGSSVGEAPAQHTGHCPSISREIARGRTEIPGTRVFLRWLGLTKPLRSAVLKLGREGTRVRPTSALPSRGQTRSEFRIPNCGCFHAHRRFVGTARRDGPR
jgi:hypothetical protein